MKIKNSERKKPNHVYCTSQGQLYRRKMIDGEKLLEQLVDIKEQKPSKCLVRIEIGTRYQPLKRTDKQPKKNYKQYETGEVMDDFSKFYNDF